MTETERFEDLINDLVGRPIRFAETMELVEWLASTAAPAEWWVRIPQEFRSAIRRHVALRESLLVVGGEVTEEYQEAYRAALRRLAKELKDVVFQDKG